MEEDKKSIKISFNKFIIIIVIFLLALISLFIILHNVKNNENTKKYDVENLNYQKITFETSFGEKNEEYKIISNYENYKSLIFDLNNKFDDYKKEMKEKYKVDVEILGNDLHYDEFTFETKNLLVVYITEFMPASFETNLTSLTEKENEVDIEISVSSHGGPVGRSYEHIYILPISKNITNVQINEQQKKEITITKNVKTTINILIPFLTIGFIIFIIFIIVMILTSILTSKKITKKNKIKYVILFILSIVLFLVIISFISADNEILSHADKPVIYLYSPEEKDVSIKLGNNDKITCSYPEYINGWNVQTKLDGNLIDLNSNRTLYSLYYECNNKVNFEMQEDGFIVKGNDIAKFLEEKLSILGLNQIEAEEFIIYWLPKLENNKYNYIRFASIDEINENMPLIINPSPDSIIRVLMTYKKLDKPIEVNEQELITPTRKGFSVVEWGVTEIK